MKHGAPASSAALDEGAQGDADGPDRAGAPRPLAAHLGAAAAAAAQATALAAGLGDPRAPWRPGLRAEAEALSAQAAGLAPAAFQRAAAEAALGDLSRLLQGIERFQAAPKPAPPPEPPAVLTEIGSARVLDYRSLALAPAPARAAAPVLLAIPSLINRATILDMSERRSFLRGLARRGVRVFMIDWGAPGPEERGFDLEDYVLTRILPAAEAVAAATGGAPVALLGHCMSGPLALAAALERQRRPEAGGAAIGKLAMIGAPWRFQPYRPQSGAPPPRDLIADLIDACGAVFGGVPRDMLNLLFFLRDPLQALRKFPRFAAEDPGGEAARRFVAVEDWLNDGPRLAHLAARTLLIDWGFDDALAAGRWRVGGAPVRAEALQAPILAIASRADTLTPYDSAAALAVAAPRTRLLRPSAGHVGMIVGRRAEREVWDPVARWLAG